MSEDKLNKICFHKDNYITKDLIVPPHENLFSHWLLVKAFDTQNKFANWIHYLLIIEAYF